MQQLSDETHFEVAQSVLMSLIVQLRLSMSIFITLTCRNLYQRSEHFYIAYVNLNVF